MTVTDEQAAAWARVACENLAREFPHSTHHVVRGPDDPSRPRVLHPSFHGSFDWHSAVHMHWLMVSVLSTHREAVDESAVVERLDADLGYERLRIEADYLAENRTYERPYGWAWLLALHAAAARCDHPNAAAWSKALEQTTGVLVELITTWAGSALPIRHGVHTNSAFAAVLIREAAPEVGQPELVSLVDAAAQRWFTSDQDAPVRYEPSAHDFLSPVLSEVDLMRRVLDPDAFAAWLETFLPGFTDDPSWMQPNDVADPSDGNQVHLYGLGLSRAWQLAALADAGSGAGVDVAVVREVVEQNLAAGLAATGAEGEFMSDHWLASFAYLALQRPF